MISKPPANIILCSSELAVPGICPHLPPGCSIAFVRTASVLCEDLTWLEAERSILVQSGFELTDVVEFDSAAEKTLKQSQAIFLGGGNTFFLLNLLRRTNFDKLITDLHSADKILIGESAGALVFGPTIDPIRFIDEPEKIPGLKDYAALKLIDFFPAVHFGRNELAEQYKAVLSAAYAQNLKVLCLRDPDFAVVSGDQVYMGTA